MSRMRVDFLSHLGGGLQQEIIPCAEKHSLCSLSNANFDKHQSKTHALECYGILCQEIKYFSESEGAGGSLEVWLLDLFLLICLGDLSILISLNCLALRFHGNRCSKSH